MYCIIWFSYVFLCCFKVEREERTDTGYYSVMADSPDTTESATTSSTNSLLSSSSSYDGEDKSKVI